MKIRRKIENRTKINCLYKLLYEIRTTRFFRMPKGEVNKVKTFYSAFVSLSVGLENFKSNGYREVCFSDPLFCPKIQTNSGHLPT